jgi:adenylate kinase
MQVLYSRNAKPKPIIICPTDIMNMNHVILITGTPCTGKTTTSKQLVQKLSADYINLTDFAKTYKLTLGEDLERQTTIIDEEAMQQKLQETIAASNNVNIIIDGHYAAAVTPTNLVFKVFVLRRNPKELKAFMQKTGFKEAKMRENLSAEILDSCLIEAMQTQQGKVCELDITGKTVDENVTEILEVLNKNKKCSVGVVDWLGLLEREGTLDEYLKA